MAPAMGSKSDRGAVDSSGNTGNTHGMKTAISLPDDLFWQVDAKARALKISRSALLARAAREFLAKGSPQSNATAAWNEAIARGGQPGDEPAALAFRRRSKRVLRGRSTRKR
jgi:predicted transcriptional regulator